VPGRPTAAQYDELAGRSYDELPAWVRCELGDVVLRVEQRPGLRPGGTPSRVTLYREPTLARARTREELERLVQQDVVRAVVARLDLEPARAAELRAAPHEVGAPAAPASA
jgi:predicted Zn-dependent protease with MMP-like domain